MTNERIRALEKGEAEFTIEERKDGWHTCVEFDFLVTTGELLKEDEITCICGYDRRKVDEYIKNGQ